MYYLLGGGRQRGGPLDHVVAGSILAFTGKLNKRALMLRLRLLLLLLLINMKTCKCRRRQDHGISGRDSVAFEGYAQLLLMNVVRC